MSYMVQPCDVYQQPSSNSEPSESDYNFTSLRRNWSNFTKSNFCSCDNCSNPNGKRLAGVFGAAWVSNKPHCCNQEPAVKFSVRYLNANPGFVKNKVGEILDTFKTQCVVPPATNEACCCRAKNTCLCNDTFSYDLCAKKYCHRCNACCKHRPVMPQPNLMCCKPICCHVCPNDTKKSKPLFGTKTFCTCVRTNPSPYGDYVCFCREKIVVNKIKLFLVILLITLIYLLLAYYFELWPFLHKCKTRYSLFTKTKRVR